MAFVRGSGLAWLAGGAVTALLIPVLVLAIGVTFWLAIAIALAAGAGGLLLLAPRRPFEGLNAERIGRGKLEFARELLADANPSVHSLHEAAKAIRAPAVRTRVEHLASQAERIIDAIEKDPLKIDPARRFFTYYLPRGVEMADGYRLLEQKPLPDPTRLQETSDLLDRLDMAFGQYGDALFSADMARLDLELKLLRASLDEDLGPVVRSPAPQHKASA